MFKRSLVPVWISIIILSGMFLLGQETWPPQPVRLLPDTGISQCYGDFSTGETGYIECPAPGEPFYGQDAQYVTNPMTFSDNGDGTVNDEVTGLIWQQEEPDIAMSWEEALTYCENFTLGESSDWRVPDVYELQSIVDYGRYDPSIDPIYFPGTKDSAYWSSSPDASDPDYAWVVLFSFSNIQPSNKTGLKYWARCVRGHQVEMSFRDNGDGTVTDNVTGLEWQQDDDDIMRTWEDALAYCEGLSLAGHTDWKLPDIKELVSIVDTGRFNPAIDPIYFPGTDDGYWSSSSFARGPAMALLVYFRKGNSSGLIKTPHMMTVRCVR